jgi:phosphatidylinositol-3-phosphatase
MRRGAVAFMLGLLLAAPAAAGAASSSIKHVFVIVLENKDYDQSFGPQAKSPQLGRELPAQGVLLTQYHGIGHLSLDNYIAMVSGQGPNPITQSDCQIFQELFPGTMGADGQATGFGCVYPAHVKTVADQLTAKGLTWGGYMEDMGNTTTEDRTCRHPTLNTPDRTQSATATDQYAARHNPFVYFHSIIDTPACASRDVPLSRLPDDLVKSHTANLSFITPNLCHDGHDEPCVNGEPGGLVSADAWLRKWVPQIINSHAFKHDGLLLVTFDEAEAEGGTADARACCNEAQFPNTPNNGGPVQGRGGGRVGAVALSPFIRPGTVTSHPYNHFSTLRTLEGLFGLPLLGYAGSPNPGRFGKDVFTHSF